MPPIQATLDAALRLARKQRQQLAELIDRSWPQEGASARPTRGGARRIQ
jgi:hypothetical protein